MNRGRRRENIFNSDRDKELFLQVAGECVRLFNVEIHAYSLMSNHYHLLICTPNANLSRAMRHLNGVYTQKINKRYKYEGSLFRGRYKSILVEEETYFLELIRYIHRNPLKAQLVENLTDHEWTSHRCYMFTGEGPEWLRKDIALSKFGKYEKSAKRKMEEFVKEEVPKDLENMLERLRWPVMLGGKEFKERIKGILRGKKIETREIPQHKEVGRVSAIEVADFLVEKVEGWDKRIFNVSKERKLVEKRRQFAYLCREYLHIPCREICNVLGGITFASVSNYYSQSRGKIESDKTFIMEIEELQTVIDQNLNIKT
jgi:REP-associated tyrosine transposase